MNIYKDKIILVTGAAGSIGTVLVSKLLEFEPKIIRAFDNNETGLHDLSMNISQPDVLRMLVGDVRDKERLIMALENVDIVFHAAALKHVPICEYNPFEATKTNILGTQNVIEAALQNNIDHMITISTDKATAPLNVMGATKLLAEKLTIAANFYKGNKKTKFSCIRFGNVLGSRGSVIPVFIKQISQFNEISLTEPSMTRFIMKIEDAIGLVLIGVQESIGGEIFVLKMPAVKLDDLAIAVIELYAPVLGLDPKSIKTKIIGRREGEKDHEKLITSDELDEGQVYIKDNVFVILPQITLKENPAIPAHYDSTTEKLTGMDSSFNSTTTKLLSLSEIKDIIVDLIRD